MKSLPGKDFCLWIVPSKDGKVRKFRITVTRLLLLASLFFVAGGAVAFITGDYVRVQMLRAKSFFSIQTLKKERDLLNHSNTSLKTELDDLKSLNSRALSYEQRVKQRLAELNSVLKASGSSAIFDESNELMLDDHGQPAHEGDGIGGAEIDCKPGQGCNDSLAGKRLAYSFLPKASMKSVKDEDLIELLDRYIELLKVIPFSSPGSAHVSSGFGARMSPFSGALKMHEGIDFALADGSAIVATADGVVKEVKHCPTYGLMIDVVHNKRIVTRYAHLSRANVKVGDKVCRGEVIGLTGSSGRSTGPHLHYEVLVDGRARDPMGFMKIAERIQQVFEVSQPN